MPTRYPVIVLVLGLMFPLVCGRLCCCLVGTCDSVHAGLHGEHSEAGHDENPNHGPGGRDDSECRCDLGMDVGIHGLALPAFTLTSANPVIPELETESLAVEKAGRRPNPPPRNWTPPPRTAPI